MKKPLLSALIVSSVALASGCQAPADQTARIDSLEQRLTTVEQRLAGSGTVASVDPSVSDVIATSSPGAVAPGSEPVASASATPEVAADLWKTLSYDDLPNPERLREFASLGFLPKAGITSQEELEGPLTRGQYVALLVAANNELHEQNKQIRLARDGDGQTFEDVPPSHPYYRYIEGMVKAGYVIGFDEKVFQPDKRLSREELLAIMAKRDYDFAQPITDNHWDIYVKFTDRDDVAPKYRAALTRDMMRRNDSNLNEAFGEVKLLHPKQDARAYEAVLSLHAMGNYSSHNFKKKVDAAMGR